MKHISAAEYVDAIVTLAHGAIAYRIFSATGYSVPLNMGKLGESPQYSADQRLIRELIKGVIQTCLDGIPIKREAVDNLTTLLTADDIDLIRRVTRFVIFTGDYTTPIPNYVINGDDGSSRQHLVQ